MLVAGFLGALTLVGCQQSAGTPTAEPPPERSKAVATQTSAPVDQNSQELLGFISPSGNVTCRLNAEFVRCDILDRAWAPPPRPADCELDYGQGITIVEGEPAQFVCAGDTTLGVDEVLPYGKAMSAGPMRCESAEAGITCRNGETGRGFFISRESYRLF